MRALVTVAVLWSLVISPVATAGGSHVFGASTGIVFDFASEIQFHSDQDGPVGIDADEHGTVWLHVGGSVLGHSNQDGPLLLHAPGSGEALEVSGLKGGALLVVLRDEDGKAIFVHTVTSGVGVALSNGENGMTLDANDVQFHSDQDGWSPTKVD